MNYKPAGFRIRVAATLIDGLMLASIGLILSFIIQDQPGDLEKSISTNIFTFIYVGCCIYNLFNSK